MIFKNLGDKEKARALYKKAEDKATDGSDLHSLAESIYKNFTDKKAFYKLIYEILEKKWD